MNNKEFDNLIRKKFQEESLTGGADGWADLSARLSSKLTRRNRLLFYRMAAALLILAGLSVGIGFLVNNQLFRKSTVEPKQLLSANKVGTSANPVKEKVDIQPLRLKKQAGLMQAPTLKPLTVATFPSAKLSFLNRKTISGNKANSVIPTELAQNEKNLSGQLAGKNKIDLSAAHHLTEQYFSQASVSEKADLTANREPYLPFVKPGGTAKQDAAPIVTYDPQNTTVAINGGMNYGRLNAGYAVGLSATHTFRNRLFIEGTVAFLYNNQTSNISNYPGQATTPSRPASYAASNAASPSLRIIPAFYYLQFNPSVGYKIGKVVSLSMGADLQERIADMSQNGTAVIDPGFDPRIIPALDLGYTGKAAFAIGQKIETGILFRSGLNNLLQPQNIYPYFNRQYVELQLKYRFQLIRRK